MPSNILSRVRAHFGGAPPVRLGVAVSGGGDSVALLHLLSQCFDPGSVELFAVTVDHGLRSDSADEAAIVAALCERLGVSHTTLRWSDWDGTGNLQGKAREARYRLISDWAKTQEIAVLGLGHTADDQAETMLMALARQSGVNGLAGMPIRRTHYGISMIRPLLDTTREELRDYLRDNGIDWIEDPSNEDRRFDRVKMRDALKVLAPLGLTAPALATVARNLAQAREALDWFTFLSARNLAVVDGGDVAFDLRQFRTLPDEISRRLLVKAISWVSGDARGPRHAAVTQALDAARSGQSMTLCGCFLQRYNRRIRISREYNAVAHAEATVPADAIWDGRWRLEGGCTTDLEVRALGREGLGECVDWRLSGRPLASLIASPALWRGDDLVAAPIAGKGAEWNAHLVGGEEEFFASLLSH